MKIYFDENFPPNIAKAINILEKNKDIDVLNITDEFGHGIADDDWIPVVGSKGGIVVTQDHNIHRMRQQRELYREHNLGLVVIKPPSKTGYKYWEQVRLIIKEWEKIIKTASRSKRPFGYILKARSSKLIDLDEI